MLGVVDRVVALAVDTRAGLRAVATSIEVLAKAVIRNRVEEDSRVVVMGTTLRVNRCERMGPDTQLVRVFHCKGPASRRVDLGGADAVHGSPRECVACVSVVT